MKMSENEIKISFDHYLLFAKNLDETVKWYGDVLNMRPGPLPDFDVPVNWLYLDDKPIMHVTERKKENQIEK